MVEAEELLKAHYNCIKGKADSPDAIQFNISLFDNITGLTEDISNICYKPLPSISFVVIKPVLREVFAANYRDRVIHHYIMLRLEPLYEKVFNARTYNCRKGKGQLYGVMQLKEDIRQCSENFTKPCWYLKCDMKGFFMSIPRKTLAEKVDRFIVEHYEGSDKEVLRYLSMATIMNDPLDGCRRKSPRELIEKVPVGKSLETSKPGHGVPIGNLTSQHNANFWLSDFDWMLERTLGFPFHGRYVDDFIIVHNSKEALLASIPKIREYLCGLGITLHPRKIMVQDAYKGVKFTGMVVKRGRVYIGNRTVAKLFDLVHYINSRTSDCDVKDIRHFVCSLNSYLGIMSHCNSYAIRRRAVSSLNDDFYRYVYVKGRFRSVRLKKRYREGEAAKRLLRNKRNIEKVLYEYDTIE